MWGMCTRGVSFSIRSSKQLQRAFINAQNFMSREQLQVPRWVPANWETGPASSLRMRMRISLKMSYLVTCIMHDSSASEASASAETFFKFESPSSKYSLCQTGITYMFVYMYYYIALLVGGGSLWGHRMAGPTGSASNAIHNCSAIGTALHCNMPHGTPLSPSLGLSVIKSPRITLASSVISAAVGCYSTRTCAISCEPIEMHNI